MDARSLVGDIELLSPPELPKPLGRHSHLSVVPASGIVAVAGQVSVDADGNLVGAGDVHAQAIQAYENVRTALGTLGLGMADVWKINAYVVGEESLQAFAEARTEAYATYFPDRRYPPLTLVAVTRLAFPELLVQIEAMAVGPRTADVR